MSRVEKAIESGRCALAVSGALLRDPDVMLALTNRASLNPMALHGPAVAPVVPVSAEGIARAVAQPGGVVVLVEPEGADRAGLEQLGAMLQRSKHKPDVVVVARSYNPFSFGTALTGLRVNHEKGRGKAFIEALPEPPPEEELPDIDVSAVTKKKRGGDIPAPRFLFTGRDEELAQLTELLGDGGPILVQGPEGVGRTWLVEHALAATELTRLPDLVIAWGSGYDTLAARLAQAVADAGDPSLLELLKTNPTVTAFTEALIPALKADGMSDRVMVIHQLDHALGRDADFFRKSRLELLLTALMTNTYALRLVLIGTRAPVFYKEGQGAALRTFAVGGLKGRFLHELFEAYKAPEFPREKFGPIGDRIHGHPMAARTYAVAVRVRQDGEKLPDDPKFMKAESLDDLSQVKKHLGKRVEKLDKKLRRALSVVAHLRYPVDAQELAVLGIDRKQRLELLSLGLLDMVGTEDDRKHQVHPLVRQHLSYREISDFDILRELAENYGSLTRKLEGVQQLAAQQEQTRCAIAGRALRLRANLEVPDHDQYVESCIGMMRAKNPRLDLVQQRLSEVINQNPANSDAWLLRLELMHKEGAKNEALEAAITEALEKAPVPEMVQTGAGLWMARRARNKAIQVLEQGMEIFPEEARFKTRLASLLLRVGRRPEAIELLNQAMALDPMLPDPYGLLGQAKRDEGAEALEDAEQLLREAVRLAPEDPVQVGRLVDLLISRARVEDAATAEMLRGSAKEMLDDALKSGRRAPEAQLMYATLLRESGGDLDRAEWFLKKARKHTDRNHDRWRRISIERALLDMARGNLDASENLIRQQIAKDPSSGEAFAALGLILSARQQFVPAHAEFMRAKERTAQNSLACRYYDQLLVQVQGIIEAQAAGLWQQAEEGTAPAPAPAASQPRVIRRAAGEAAEAAPAAEAEQVEAAPAAEAEQVEAAPAAEAEQVEAAPAAEPAPATSATPADVDAALSAAEPAPAPEPEVHPEEVHTPAEVHTATDDVPAGSADVVVPVETAHEDVVSGPADEESREA